MQPCFIFAGEQFEHDQELKHVKSLLLDLFRGHIVTGIDLLVSSTPINDALTSHLFKHLHTVHS